MGGTSLGHGAKALWVGICIWVGTVVSLRGARPQPLLGKARALGDPASFPQSWHLVGETHSVSQTLNMDGVPEGNAWNGWWRILEYQK